jgi:hypothetical protein
MRRISPQPVLLTLILVAHAGVASGQNPPAVDREAKIENAMSAAPPAIAHDAAVSDWDNTKLRAGTNGWTCFPDPPGGPGDTPMCLDSQWVQWTDAWANKQDPDVSALGIAYMLQGGFAASNTDPYATEPAPGDEWITHGPHILIIVPDVAVLTNLPTDPASNRPWVMWQGTRYAHLHVPVTN